MGIRNNEGTLQCRGGDAELVLDPLPKVLQGLSFLGPN
jgi:hypothetical protein